MDGTYKSVKSKSSRNKTHNFSARGCKTFLPGTGLQKMGNTLWRMALLTTVAAQEILLQLETNGCADAI
jgi:hypothetical protein